VYTVDKLRASAFVTVAMTAATVEGVADIVEVVPDVEVLVAPGATLMVEAVVEVVPTLSLRLSASTTVSVAVALV
jgi:hypothetical protein